MSLFEDPRFQWRETYFVLFRRQRRPDAPATCRLLERLEQRFDLRDIRLDEHGRLESLTACDLAAGAGVDLCYVAGRDVCEQVAEFMRGADAGSGNLPPETCKELQQCDARFEVFHFEAVDYLDEDDDQFDPGSLFEFLQELEAYCGGISIDPQSGTVV